MAVAEKVTFLIKERNIYVVNAYKQISATFESHYCVNYISLRDIFTASGFRFHVFIDRVIIITDIPLVHR